MARSYYSTIFEQSADEVIWTAIRDFNNYPVWVDGAGESEIEAGKSGDSVGAVRNVLYNGVRRRQKLLALSDTERSQTYGFASEPPHTRDFRATLRVTPATWTEVGPDRVGVPKFSPVSSSMVISTVPAVTSAK